MQPFIRGGKHCHRIELTKMSLRWWNEFQKLPGFWGPRTNARSVFFSCHFQDKPGRCSEGSWVNLMTIAMSSSRNLFISASREKPCAVKSQVTCLRTRRDKNAHPSVCLCFYHGPQALVTGTLSWPGLWCSPPGGLHPMYYALWLTWVLQTHGCKDKASGKSEGGTGKAELKLIRPR